MDEAGQQSDPALFKDRVGQRLRSAREHAGLDLADVAARTRIPLRHLSAIEASDYSKLPSPTYSVGFVKSYARAIGLDENELGQDLRDELGTLSPLQAANAQNYEPIDPLRIAPKWLALSAAALAVLLFGGYMVWRHNVASEEAIPTVQQVPVTGSTDNAAVANGADIPTANAAAPMNSASAANVAAPVTAPTVAGSVVLTAANSVWVRIYDVNDKVLFEKEMKAGEAYTVPADANHPQIRTGAAELINVTVGGKTVPQLGKAQRTIKDVDISVSALLARPSPSSSAAAATPTLTPHTTH